MIRCSSIYPFRKTLCVCLFLSAALAVSPAFSAQVLGMKEQERLQASVSGQALNRLQVLGDRIASVFGSKGAFSLEPEEVKGQVFLKVHAGAPAQLDLSVITESGLTQDMTLRVEKSEGQTILLKPPRRTETWGTLSRFSAESLDLLRAMATSRRDAGYERQLTVKPLRRWRDVEVTLMETWTGEGMTGSVYVVRNKGHNARILREKAFCFSPRIRAVALQAPVLKPGAVLKVYTVASHED